MHAGVGGDAAAGQTLILKLRIAYFGALRARVHTPFGWLRLTKNTKWGDAKRRAQIDVEIHTELELGADYQLRARSSLHALSFSAPRQSWSCASSLAWRRGPFSGNTLAKNSAQ